MRLSRANAVLLLEKTKTKAKRQKPCRLTVDGLPAVSQHTRTTGNGPPNIIIGGVKAQNLF